MPPLREERLYTGDLIDHNENVYVIVTPQCNIANSYPDHFLLAGVRIFLKSGPDAVKKSRTTKEKSAEKWKER